MISIPTTWVFNYDLVYDEYLGAPSYPYEREAILRPVFLSLCNTVMKFL